MPTIEGELRTQTEDPRNCPGLVDFRCGDGRLPAEAVVEEIILGYRTFENRSLSVRVTREDSGAIVGLAGIKKRGIRLRNYPFLQQDAYRDATLIEVLALNEPYRGGGGWVNDQGVPVSQVVLMDALAFIDGLFEGPIRPVQAIIAPENRPSRDLVEYHGFSMAEPPTAKNLLYVRPRGLEIRDPSSDSQTEDTGNEEASD